MPFLSLFSFKGKTSRLTYALIALPILLALANGRLLSKAIFTILNSSAPPSPVQLGLWMVFASLLLNLLYLPLLSISFKRLHDIGLSGVFSLLHLIAPVIRFAAEWFHISTIVAPGEVAAPGLEQAASILRWVGVGVYWLSLVLAFALCVVPERKQNQSKPIDAF